MKLYQSVPSIRRSLAAKTAAAGQSGRRAAVRGLTETAL